eukprot:Selendium_serpulae@DN4731_c0_g1_i2.p1
MGDQPLNDSDGMVPEKMVVAEYLFRYLYRINHVTHIFGIPGDFALPLFKYMEQAEPKLHLVSMAHEPAVGFAADAYARHRGLGVGLVTYGVGGLNMVNRYFALL